MKVCPDTNVWLEWSRSAAASLRIDQGRLRVHLATIVLQEIWAGARTAEERAFVERLHALAARHRRVLNPPTPAWILSGQVLALLARRRRLAPARLRALRNDVLLAVTALMHGAAVLTRNLGDFRLVAEVLPVRVVAPQT